ncbi:hypothetical protein Kpho02_77650 [Kitasatospora phosalacinea]|uniref:Uncharacterized protein n=1 Tax=Kitasatospora phosalacinea TaxID=2065 RepID=A0A9W6V6M9_9ACTN|nr:hypothetical protein [Kitasatospora phosalacinea]GLW75468.1 hypothetical protein Kpho02_77650 [Kitasatospora phosalacinea]
MLRDPGADVPLLLVEADRDNESAGELAEKLTGYRAWCELPAEGALKAEFADSLRARGARTHELRLWRARYLATGRKRPRPGTKPPPRRRSASRPGASTSASRPAAAASKPQHSTAVDGEPHLALAAQRTVAFPVGLGEPDLAEPFGALTARVWRGRSDLVALHRAGQRTGWVQHGLPGLVDGHLILDAADHEPLLATDARQAAELLHLALRQRLI